MRFLSFIERDEAGKQSLGNLGDGNSNLGQDLHRLSGDFDITIWDVFVELIEHVSQIHLIGELAEDFNFNVFYVGGLVYLAVEVFEVFLIELFPIHMTNHVLNMFQNHIHCFEGPGAFIRAH